MTNEIAVPVLDRYRAIHAARIAEAERERRAAEKREADKKAAELAEQQRKITAMAEHLLGPALVGWEVVTESGSWHHRYWDMRRAFGEDTVTIRARCHYSGSGIGSVLNRVEFTALDGRNRSADFWVNVEQPDHAAAEAAIAMVCVEALDDQRADREHRELRESTQREHQARRERANTRLAELAGVAEGYVAGRADGLLTKYGWPQTSHESGGPAELVVWKIEWVMGVGEYGDVDRREAFATHPEPAPDGTFAILTNDDLVRKVITTRNAIEATELTWRSVDDLPCGFRQKVTIQRFCQVEIGGGSAVGDYVERGVVLPGAAVRLLLGLPTDAIKGLIRDDVCEDAEGSLVEKSGASSEEEDLRDLPV